MIKKTLSKLFGLKSESSMRHVQARFDAASHNSENDKHWLAAEYLSADAEANAGVRKTLRVRSRYEVANNSYAQGMIQTLANDTVGTGPRLQVLSDDDELNLVIENSFQRWARQIDLAGKLRTVRIARCQDGESFIILAENPKIPSDMVQLDLQVIEADRICDGLLVPPVNCFDGVQFDDYGNPVSFRMMKFHPGSDEYGANDESVIVPAEFMIHYFRPTRPGLHRGIPEITPALPLFAQLRRFTLAVLSAAEAAADFAAILYTDIPPNGEAEDVDPMDSIPLRRNMMLTVPAGWKLGQLDPKQPCSTYSEFKSQILSEIARCLQMPFNIAAGNSSGYNYASGRLDHQTYFKSLNVERHVMQSLILDRVFKMWLREYCLLTKKQVPEDIRWTWFWDGFPHVDPVKEANAINTKLKNGTTTFAAVYSEKGLDWEKEFEQIAKERRRMSDLGISFADLEVGRPVIELEDETNE